MGRKKSLSGRGSGRNGRSGVCPTRQGDVDSLWWRAGSDDQRRSPVETGRGPTRALIGQAWGAMVDRSKAESGVGKEGAGRAVSPGQS